MCEHFGYRENCADLRTIIDVRGFHRPLWTLAPGQSNTARKNLICYEARMCRSALFGKMTETRLLQRQCPYGFLEFLTVTCSSSVSRGLSVLCMNVCVQASNGCKQLTTNDFSKLQRLEAGSLTLCHLKHERKISGCVTARAKYTNAGHVPLWTV